MSETKVRLTKAQRRELERLLNGHATYWVNYRTVSSLRELGLAEYVGTESYGGHRRHAITAAGRSYLNGGKHE